MKRTRSLAQLVVLAVAVFGCSQPPPEPPPPTAKAPAPAPIKISVTPKSEQAPPEAVSAAPVEVAQPSAAEPERVIAGDNLLKNGDFEQFDKNLAAYWAVYVPEQAVLARDEEQHVDGQASLRVTVPGNVNMNIAQFVKVEAGASYRLSGYIKTKGALGTALLSVGCAPEGAFKGFVAQSEKVVDGEDWRALHVDFVAPSDLPKGEVMVTLRRIAKGDEGAVEGALWFDRYSLNRIEVPASPNMLANPGFEDWVEDPADATKSSPVNWGPMPDGAKVSREAQDKVEGAASLRVELGSRVNLCPGQNVRVKPGGRYVLLGWMKTRGVGGRAQLTAGILPAGGWGGFRQAGEVMEATQEWTELSLVFTVPADAPADSVLFVPLRRIDDPNGPESQGVIWFDGYRLYELPSAQ